jgi:hypothetical protein
VVPLAVAPVLVRTERWKETAYQWFKHAGPGDPVPVLAAAEAGEEGAEFAAVLTDLPPEMPRKALPAPPELREELDTDRVVVTGTRPGHPILVRISYHPRWQAVTGEQVWLAAPNFMLVFPRGDRVELQFGSGPALKVGRVLTGLGLVFVLASLMPARWKGRVTRRIAEAGSAWQPVATAVARVRRASEWPDAQRRRMLAGGLAIVVAVLGTVAVVNSGSDADSLYRKGQKLYAADRLQESLPYFRDAHRLAPLSATAVHARYFEALVYLRGEQWREAGERFQSLVETFPEAINAPEALYHVGLCRDRVGNAGGAVEAWQETMRRFPETTWAGFARQRLTERGHDVHG